MPEPVIFWVYALDKTTITGVSQNKSARTEIRTRVGTVLWSFSPKIFRVLFPRFLFRESSVTGSSARPLHYPGFSCKRKKTFKAFFLAYSMEIKGHKKQKKRHVRPWPKKWIPPYTSGECPICRKKVHDIEEHIKVKHKAVKDISKVKIKGEWHGHE